MDEHEKENSAVTSTTIAEFNSLGEELVKEKYEKSADVQQRATQISQGSSELAQLAVAKRSFLDKEKKEIEELTQTFANLVNPLAKLISSNKEKVLQTSASLEDQLKIVETFLSSADNDGSSLSQIKVQDEKITKRGITDNDFTSLSSIDVEIQVNKKKTFLWYLF